jgi:hypothetical protein
MKDLSCYFVLIKLFSFLFLVRIFGYSSPHPRRVMEVKGLRLESEIGYVTRDNRQIL